jgi:hypothetical protein
MAQARSLMEVWRDDELAVRYQDVLPMRAGQAVANLPVRYAQEAARAFAEERARDHDQLLPWVIRLSSGFGHTAQFGMEFVAPPIVTGPPEGAALLDESDFETVLGCLSQCWINETEFDSSLDAIFGHPAFVLLLKLGRRAARHALLHIDEDPERWAVVLSHVTGAQPLPPNTPREDAGRLWKRWAAEHDWV